MPTHKQKVSVWCRETRSIFGPPDNRRFMANSAGRATTVRHGGLGMWAPSVVLLYLSGTQSPTASCYRTPIRPRLAILWFS